jgi:hypothetical protein
MYVYRDCEEEGTAKRVYRNAGAEVCEAGKGDERGKSPRLACRS